MKSSISFGQVRTALTTTLQQLPDKRTSPNRLYTLGDAGLAAFSVFFTQSPSFLAFQRQMQRQRGRNNAHSLFGVDRIPSDPQIRNLLDTVDPANLYGAFWALLALVDQAGYLADYHDAGSLLLSLDGTGYFSSTEIHCANCTKTVQRRHHLLQPQRDAAGARLPRQGRSADARTRVHHPPGWGREAGL